MLEYQSITENELLTEKQKSKETYLINQIDMAIAELVYDKDYLRKAYNYYNGERDKEQFQFLEENFGIGTPTSIEFIPLIRSHIDVLIGEHLQNKLKPYISCKDKETLSKINEDKKRAIYEAEINTLKKQLGEMLTYATENKDTQEPPKDNASESYLQKLKEDIERDFISDFEISAHYVLKHIIQNKNIDLINKLKILYLDLLVAGQCYYKVSIKRIGETPRIEVYNPFDVFVDLNPNTTTVNKSTRAVVRKWLNKQQIISDYAMYMDSNDLDKLDSMMSHTQSHEVYYMRSSSGSLITNVGVGVGDAQKYNNEFYKNYNLIPVYEVEWIANNKIKNEFGETDYRKDRYEGVRIGENIYLNMGLADNIVRSVENPLDCNISLNGTTFNDRGNKPYSLVLMTAGLQDKYDILHFYRDQLIASSGVKGDYLDIAQLPKFLGETESERILKYVAYKKTGLALLDTSQEGTANLNTLFSGYDDTVSGQSVEAIQFAIDATAATASSITGVFRERIGGIEQRDAVTNVEVGIKQSAIITKQYFHMMDSVTKELLLDALNMCKISYKEGKVGSIILGNKMQKIFTIDPNKFSMTDYDVHLTEAGDTIKDIETIKGVTVELIKAGSIDIDIMLEALTSESLTEMKENVSKSYKKKQEENNQLQQATQQLEQMQNQMKQLQMELTKSANENEQLKQKVDALREKEIMIKYEIEKERNRITEENNETKNQLDRERIDLEKLQLLDDNPHNNEINYGK